MNYTIKLFGVLTEIATTDQVIMSSKEALSRDGIFDKLYEQFPAFKLVQCQLAVNKSLNGNQGEIGFDAELVLMPPFAGG